MWEVDILLSMMVDKTAKVVRKHKRYVAKHASFRIGSKTFYRSTSPSEHDLSTIQGMGNRNIETGGPINLEVCEHPVIGSLRKQFSRRTTPSFLLLSHPDAVHLPLHTCLESDHRDARPSDWLNSGSEKSRERESACPVGNESGVSRAKQIRKRMLYMPCH
jgi:hypothetical protein